MTNRIINLLFLTMLLVSGMYKEASAQNSQIIDFYKEKLEQFQNQKLKLIIGNKACEKFQKTHKTEKLKETAENNIQLASLLNDSTYLALSHNYLGYYYRIKKDTANAEANLLKALTISNKAKNDTVKADIYFELAHFYNKLLKDKQEAIANHTKALEIRQQYNNIKKIGDSYNALGLLYKSQSRYSSSLNYFEKSLKIQEKLKDTAAIIRECNNIGSSLSGKYDYGQAFNYYQRVLSMLGNKKEKNYKEYARAMSNMGVLHRYNKEYDLALDYFKRAYDIYKAENYKIGLIQTETYICFSYIDKKKYNEALVYAKASLEKTLELQKPNPISLAFRYRALGDIYTGKRNLNQAIRYYDLSLDNSRKGDNSQYIVYALKNKASVLHDFKKNKEALKFVEPALELAIKDEHKYLEKSCHILKAQIKFSMGDFESAYKDMHDAFLMQEAISLETQKRGLTDAQAIFRTNILEEEKIAKEKEVEAKNAKLKEQEIRSKFQIAVIIGTLGITIAIAIFGGFLFKQKREIQEKNKTLEEQNNQINEQKEELEQTLFQLKQTQNQLVESEKMASLGNLVAGVAHEMNTPIGIGVQATSAIVNRSTQVAEGIKTNTINKLDILDFIEHTYQSSHLALSNLRRTGDLIKSFKLVSVDQSTEQLRKFNIHSYFSDVIISLKPKLKKQNVDIFVDCPDDLEIRSYPGVFAQIITNLVLNSLTHGFKDKKDGKITISVTSIADNYNITYQDNGSGMDKNTCTNVFEPFFTTNKQKGTGLGMHIIYNLVSRKLKGKISCFSEKGKGVTFEIEIKNSKPEP